MDLPSNLPKEPVGPLLRTVTEARTREELPEVPDDSGCLAGTTSDQTLKDLTALKVGMPKGNLAGEADLSGKFQAGQSVGGSEEADQKTLPTEATEDSRGQPLGQEPPMKVALSADKNSDDGLIGPTRSN